uniref:Uncharacterized mitochondrial protein AtMg00810-like n=1 Tax=Nicotiana tabacum TaxID=4097 RepID=A0A1S3YRV0_TOBAC|nr:PREDICTED: uncharacterized mitochondrial protein AtMg00810-like [Nicotiana tabacum]
MVTVRSVISLAASTGWKVFQMDVNIAFLQGYVQSAYDHSLFTKKSGIDLVIILIYVDDLMITGNSSEMIDEVKRSLHKSFKLKDLGKVIYFLGIEIMRSHKGILLNQRKYTLELKSDLGLSGAKPASSPLEQNQKLTTIDYDKHVRLKGDEELTDIGGCQMLIGKLIYLTIIRHDICFAVQVLSQFMQHPKQSHLEAAMKVVKYIKGSPGKGILLKKGTLEEITAYCDSDWAACTNTKRLVTDYVIKLGESLIS